MLAQDDIEDVIYAARTGSLEDLQSLSSKHHLLGSKDLLACVDNGNTPLHMAGANGHVDCVLFLLRQLQPLEDGVQFVNTQNSSGNTALHWACLNGHLDVVAALVKEGRADPFLNNAAGLDALYEAEANDKKEVVEWLLANVDYAQSLGNQEDEELQPGMDGVVDGGPQG